MAKSILILFFLLISGSIYAQDTLKIKQSFLTPSEDFNKKRFYGIVGVSTGFYSGALIGLNYLWYKDYPRTKFHFFDDSKEWQQVDKIGHIHTAYFESVWSIQALNWAGVDDRKAAIYGGAIGFFLQSSIEVLDGFSEKWGASATDLISNGVGCMMASAQHLAWNEQRILMKFSSHSVSYPKGILEDRADNLYGSGPGEKLLKDYNRQAYWVSVNTASFFPDQKRLKWLNVAVGYGAGGMYGGFENKWEDADGQEVDYQTIERYRQFFLSIDADFTRIQTNSQSVKALLWVINIFKMPAPAMEFNTKGQVIFHPMYYLNWEVPIFIKK